MINIKLEIDNQATLKKSLFPVQRVAIIVAAIFFPLYRNGRKNAGEKKEKSGNVKKK